MAKPFSIRARFKSFRFAMNGLKHLTLYEHNFRVHLFVSALVIFSGFYFKVGLNEWLWLLFAIGLVLVAEGFNSAIEELVDLVSPQANLKAGLVKDIAAAVVLIASFIAAIIGALIFYPYIF